MWAEAKILYSYSRAKSVYYLWGLWTDGFIIHERLQLVASKRTCPTVLHRAIETHF